MNSVDLYISENMEGLATDIAKGDGEYVDTLAQMLKVENKAAFKEKLHKNFNKIYTSKDITAKEVSENIKQIQNS